MTTEPVGAAAESGGVSMKGKKAGTSKGKWEAFMKGKNQGGNSKGKANKGGKQGKGIGHHNKGATTVQVEQAHTEIENQAPEATQEVEATIVDEPEATPIPNKPVTPPVENTGDKGAEGQQEPAPAAAPPSAPPVESNGGKGDANVPDSNAQSLQSKGDKGTKGSKGNDMLALYKGCKGKKGKECNKGNKGNVSNKGKENNKGKQKSKGIGKGKGANNTTSLEKDTPSSAAVTPASSPKAGCYH